MKTKHSLLTSCISLLLCFVMLLGTTFAWFTDVATSSGNVIETGNLDIALMKGTPNGNGGWTWTENNGEAIFDYENWEPGYTTWAALAVQNNGSLAARWQAMLTLNGTPTILADVIEVYSTYDHLFDSTSRLDFGDGTWQKMGTVRELLDNDGMLMSGDFIEPGHRQPIVIALHMREDAGNEYQDLDLGANFDIKIIATQASFENDSFGNDYDKDAQWPGTTGFETTASLNQVQTIYGELANDFIIRYSDSVYALLPAGTKLADGVDSLKFSGKSVENGSNITLGEGDSAQSYDIHIEGIADDNNVAITVYLGPILDKNISDTSLKLYHEDALMTRVNSVSDFATNNQYTYDPATGDLVIYVDNFSVFSAVETTASEWEDNTVADTSWYNETKTEFTLEDVADFLGFRDLVDGGNTFAGKTVKLGVDINLADKCFDPIGFGYWYEKNVVEGKDQNTVFMGTFDGGNHTIYNLYENCWELDTPANNYSTYTYSTAGAGLFASIKDATIKNLAISGAEVVFECVDMGVLVGYAQGECHFENIVVTDAKIANYNRYTGGLVGEVSYGPYGIDTTKGYSHTFKNITVDSTVTVSGLWGSFGCGMGGVIGGKWGDATVKMENVVSAAEMDVYNDVVSAYQWYAFRGCGMLIGHTEEPYSDGRHSGNATASFLTCENVKVYYGDWVNQHYYQFANQTDKDGNTLWYSNYPWVRVEAGEYCDAFSNIRYGIPQVGGVKVTELSEEKFNEAVTGRVEITFDQLYGADQGMYGTATHPGVTVSYKNTKTIYIKNNLDWTDLKLDYWYVSGGEIWTTLAEPSVLTEENGVYKVDIPAFAHGFKIVADDENETRDFYLSEVVEGSTYTLDFEHVHNFIGVKCDCGAVKVPTEHQFTLGEDGEAKHSDGGNAVTTYEENGYTLTLTGISSLYGNARDEMGNSCIKLGTGSLIGKFSFTVPENVDKVIIYVAGYKANTAKIIVNDIEYEITTLSNDGEYTAIEVDTSETKTVSFTTAYNESEPRCMINTISYVTAKVIEVHDCDEDAELLAVDPTCTETGLTAGRACSVCGKVMVEQETVAATGHTEETIPAVDVTCTKNGLTEGTKCSVCDDILVAQETIVSTGHNYVDGVCSVCDEAFPQTSGTYTYIFSEYTAGTQYAKGEVHELDEYVTITTYDCHFTDELRIYSSSTNNGYAIIYSANPISKIAVNAGNKLDTINIYGSDDGINWTAEPIATISVTDTSYKDYTAELKDEYKYLKLDVEGTNQVRIKSMTLTTVPDCAHTSTTTETIDPTCTEAGYTVEKCASCGKEMNRTNEVAATGHVNTTTDEKAATCTEAGSVTVTCDDCGATVSTEEIAATGHQNTTETTVNATCTEAGSTIVTCDDCGATVSTETIPIISHADVNTDNDHNCDACGAENVTDHNYVDGTCNCGAAEPTEPETPTTNNRYYIATKRSTGNYFYMTSDLGTASTKRYTAVDSGLTTLPASISSPEKGYVFVLIDNGDGTYSLQAEGVDGNNYLGWTSGNSGTLVSEANALKLTVEVNNGVYNIHFAASDAERYLALNGTSGNNYFAWYKSGQKQDLVLIPVVDGGSSEPDTTPCQHTNTTETTVDATCTAAGSTTVTCNDCGETVSTETIDALGHKYVGVVTDPSCTAEGYTTYTCSVCNNSYVADKVVALGHTDANNDNKCDKCGEATGGATDSVEITVELSFADKTNRTSFSTTKQVWEQNGITLTNNKASSSNNVADYAKPVRFYASSSLVVECSGMTEIVFDCNNASYATALKNSIGTVSEATVTVSSDKVTVTFTSAVDSFTIAKLTAQVRMDSITVTYTK